MRAVDRALRIIARHGHGTAVESHSDLLLGRTFQPVCIEDGCNWRGGFIATLARAQAIGDEHHDKTAGTWGPAR